MDSSNQQNEDINKHEGEYLLSFVEEFGFNPKYRDWVYGRIEVGIYTEIYAIDEIDFRFPNKSKEWIDFREKYDTYWASGETLEEVKRIAKEKFYVQFDSI